MNVLERQEISDFRGHFSRMFCKNELEAVLENRKIVQINHSFTQNRGTVRGLHFQYPPWCEMKFVTCVRGEVFDVAIDIRRNSPTFLKHHSVILSEKNNTTFCIPEGFAHGFQTLSDNSELLYFHTESYHKEAEGVLDAKDQKLSIPWPISIFSRSERDSKSYLEIDSFQGLNI